MKRLCAMTAAFSFTLVLGASAGAQTPDGMPPSTEGVCDELDGNAYGLCTAYCEAMDCDSVTPQASAQACARVQARYQAADEHRNPPCVDSCAHVTPELCHFFCVFDRTDRAIACQCYRPSDGGGCSNEGVGEGPDAAAQCEALRLECAAEGNFYVRF